MRPLFSSTFVATSVLLASSSVAFAQGQINSTKAGFTLTVPAGWRVADAQPAANLSYKIAVTAQYNGFTPNIVITDEVYGGTTDKYADAAAKTFATMLPGSKFISKSPFKTRGGVAGTKLVMRNVIQGNSLRQVAYMFPNKTGLLLIFTVTSPVDQGLKHDKTIDAAMLNLVIDK